MDAQLASLLSTPIPIGWQPTGKNRNLYLDLMERIVREAQAWQNEQGAIIDPVANEEFAQTTPRYASPAAILLSFGRCQDLKESVCRAMDWSCMRLATGQAKSPDFWMRELMTAYDCLLPLVNSKRTEVWATHIRAVIPERTYKQVRPGGVDLAQLHNWTIYAVAGEMMRANAGLAPADANIIWGQRFFSKYMPPQFEHFTLQGLYRDPNDPMTYDFATRLQATIPLANGYNGPLRDKLAETLRRGAITQLFYVTSSGYAPYGGRSSQYQFQEAMIAAICEYEATQLKTTDPRLAGAFKRQAHRSAEAVTRWLTNMNPFRHIKNGFDPKMSMGYDSYGMYSVYSLLAASVLGLAAQWADDSISESPCPAEIGGYVLHLDEGFHKVFATAGGTHVEIDTCADPHYDATGLGRFCLERAPLELGLGMPFTATPAYRLPVKWKPSQSLAIGPEWKKDTTWCRLSELGLGLKSTVRVTSETTGRVDWNVKYQHGDTVIVEKYDLRKGELRICSSVTIAGQSVRNLRFLIPLLVTDGQEASTIKCSPGHVEVHYRGACYEVEFAPMVKHFLDDRPMANRNGVYKCLTLETNENEMQITLRLT